MILATAGIYAYGYTKIIPLILFAFASFSLFTILLQFFNGMRKKGAGIIFKNRRFYGGLVIHFGVMVMAYGVIASSFYNVKVEKVVSPGSKINMHQSLRNSLPAEEAKILTGITPDFELFVGNLKVQERRNYVSVYAPVDVKKNGRYKVTMTPERRFYKNNEQPFAEVAIHTQAGGDLYLILASYSKPDNVIGIQAIYEPFIVWIWIGCALMVVGGLYTISYRRKESDIKTN
jgi:cytochrome c-type biogenesis protein CcmF